MRNWPQVEKIGKIITRLGIKYISVESPPDSCAGCAGAFKPANKGGAQHKAREALCSSLPNCTNVIWKEYKDGEVQG